jgi:L-asparaginase/Glu-tRNA(Gln) amidotransferase subunit D
MNTVMALVVVPVGGADKVIRAANEAGASGATILRARGSSHAAHKAMFGFSAELEEEIVLITASRAIITDVCAGVNAPSKDAVSGGRVYILPIV